MNKKTPLDEAERIQQAILEREVEEELQKERLLNFWKKYRFCIIGGIIGIIAITAGTQFYHAWRTKIRIAESDQFEQAIHLNFKGERNSAIEILNQLEKTSKTGYKHLSQLKIAGIYLKSDADKQKGLDILKKFAQDKSAPENLRDIALLSYIGNQADALEPSKLSQELAPLLAKKNEFYGSAVELQAALYLRENKKEDASRLLTEALTNPNVIPTTKQRFQELLTVINKEEK